MLLCSQSYYKYEIKIHFECTFKYFWHFIFLSVYIDEHINAKKNESEKKNCELIFLRLILEIYKNCKSKLNKYFVDKACELLG